MSEIKSAIELAMERTKNLVMDEEEKRASQTKEMENKTRATVRRYMEGMIEIDRASAEFEEIEGNIGEKKVILLNLLFEEIDLAKDNTRALDALKVIGGSRVSPMIKDFEKMEERLSRSLEKQELTVRKRIESRLKEMGISGSAVEPNTAAWDESIMAREEAARDMEGQIGEWKKRLVEALIS